MVGVWWVKDYTKLVGLMDDCAFEGGLNFEKMQKY